MLKSKIKVILDIVRKSGIASLEKQVVQMIETVAAKTINFFLVATSFRLEENVWPRSMSDRRPATRHNS